MNIINEKNYVDEAEKVIKNLSNKIDKRNQKKVPMVTTSKIRNLLAMTADIYNNVLNSQEENLSNELVGRIEYLRLRFVYESGRDTQVKDFVESAGILDIIKEIKGKKSAYILFNRYMEALVAFHKYYGGKDY